MAARRPRARRALLRPPRLRPRLSPRPLPQQLAAVLAELALQHRHDLLVDLLRGEALVGAQALHFWVETLPLLGPAVLLALLLSGLLFISLLWSLLGTWSFLNLRQETTPVETLVAWLLAAWLVVGFFAVVRFLQYLDLRIGAIFPLRDAAAAQDALTGRATTGKVILMP